MWAKNDLNYNLVCHRVAIIYFGTYDTVTDSIVGTDTLGLICPDTSGFIFPDLYEIVNCVRGRFFVSTPRYRYLSLK